MGHMQHQNVKYKGTMFGTGQLFFLLLLQPCTGCAEGVSDRLYTDYSVVDDCSEGSLVSSQTMQVEGETLKQCLVAHL